MNALEATFANLEKRGLSRVTADKDRPAPATVPESKVDATTRAAKTIIDAETEARDTRTAALRSARLEKAASQPKTK